MAFSHRAAASASEDVASTSAQPERRRRTHQRAQGRASVGVDVCERFVEKECLRLAGEGARERESLPLPGRERPRIDAPRRRRDPRRRAPRARARAACASDVRRAPSRTTMATFHSARAAQHAGRANTAAQRAGRTKLAGRRDQALQRVAAASFYPRRSGRAPRCPTHPRGSAHVEHERAAHARAGRVRSRPSALQRERAPVATATMPSSTEHVARTLCRTRPCRRRASSRW